MSWPFPIPAALDQSGQLHFVGFVNLDQRHGCSVLAVGCWLFVGHGSQLDAVAATSAASLGDLQE
jgi:hypothetical protein